MFDRYHRSTPEVHVHNRIESKPHDPADAARLYGELKEKAEAEVADATVQRLGAHNEVRIVSAQPRYDTGNVRVLFDLNGVKFDFEVGRAEVQDRVFEVIAKTVALALLRQLPGVGP